MIRRLASPDPDHLERLAAVHQAAFAPASRGWSAAEIASLADGGVLLADEADRGFVLYSRAADEAELLTVAIDPDHRRQGLARQLLETGEETLRELGVAKVYLEVAADNPAAAGLYRRLGFQVSGIRKGYYRRAEEGRIDAMMMAKQLSAEHG